MDKTGIFVVVLCVIGLGAWFFYTTKEQEKLAQAQAIYDATNKVAMAVTTTNANGAIISTQSATATVTGGAITTSTAPVVFDTATPEQTLTLTNGRARYTFTSRGGGLKLVELLDYPEKVSARWRSEVHSGPVASLNTHAPIAALTVLGNASLIGDGNFTLTQTATGVHAEKALPDGLVMTKDFSFSSNYLVNASVSLRNESGQAVTVPAQEYVVGTATPMDVDDSGQLWGTTFYDGTNATIEPVMQFTGGGFGCSHREPRSEIVSTPGNVLWASANNQFFALLAIPSSPASAVVARTVSLPRFQDTNDTSVALPPQGVETALVYPAQSLAAGMALNRDFALYAGPKEFRTLQLLGEKYNNHADEVMNFGSGYASFWGIGTFFAKLLLSAMNILHDITNIGYGWLIVIITIIIRALFWPLTAISLRSSKKMQALQPQVAALKEKYKDDMQKFGEKQMELWKKNGVNPMSGCFPMLVQMPVFMGFFTMIRSAIELRGASFLWAADLSKPDTLLMIPGITFIPILSTPQGLPFNLLPLLMVGVMVWQAHLQPPSPGMDPGQQKMMRYIPLMFLLFFYNYSSGMALYMMVSTMAGIVQTKLTRISMATTPAVTPAPKPKK